MIHGNLLVRDKQYSLGLLVRIRSSTLGFG